MADFPATTTQATTYIRRGEEVGARAYFLTTGVSPPPDPTRPVVTILAPLPVGSQIGVTTPLQFQVTDNLNSFRRILVVVTYPGLRVTELVYDGEAFTEAYELASTTMVIANGLQFSLRRNVAWPDSPTLRIYAYDTSGNENL